MKYITRYFLLLALIYLSCDIWAQNVYTIKADSVKITNCDSSELIIENHTQNVPGFLFNTGNGRTIFKRGCQKLNDSTYLIGADTVTVQPKPWVQGGNAFASTGILGTFDNQHLDFYTNDSARMRLTNQGGLVINGYDPLEPAPMAASSKLNVNGSAYVAGSFLQGYTQVAQMGNGLIFAQDSYESQLASRIYSSAAIKYRTDGFGDQHIFENDIGIAMKGTFVTIDPGFDLAFPDSQLVLKVYGMGRGVGLNVNMLGYTGIGTLNPSAQLHTTGTVRFAGLANDSSQTRVVVSDASGNLFYRDASSLASKDPVRSSLAVNGTITAQRLKLSQTGWPDYVFDSSYQLLPMDQLEKYIKQNNHLPGISSAAEVERQGVDVGDNQAALLKKVEELTLYAIGQNKEIDSLKREVNELKKLILKKSNKE
jgi:hypothetical protein